MNQESPLVLNVSHRYAASAERVFDAFLNPEIAGRFMFATPTGQMIHVSIDPVVGGEFVFTDRREDGDIEHRGTYLVLERPSKIVFAYSVPKYSTDLTEVTIEIKPTSEGCELTLTHIVEPEWADYMDRTVKGWTMILDNLGETIGA